MRFSLAVVVVAAGVCLSASAQQYKVKHSNSEKAPKKAVSPTKSATSGSATAVNSKDLEALEQQTARTSAPRATGKQMSRTKVMKATKDKANPPIKLSGSGSKRVGESGRQSSNPYKGRLKQKHGHQ